MLRAFLNRFRLPTGAAGLFLAMLALAGQMALGATVAPGEPSDAGLLELGALGVICHADAPADTDHAPSPHRHSPDCAICPLCVAMAMPATAVVASGPMLPAPTIALVGRASVPAPVRGPPSRPLLIARPRGPPVLT